MGSITSEKSVLQSIFGVFITILHSLCLCVMNVRSNAHTCLTNVHLLGLNMLFVVSTQSSYELKQNSLCIF